MDSTELHTIVQKIQQLNKENKHEEMLRLAQEAFQRFPNNLDIVYQLAIAFLKLKQNNYFFACLLNGNKQAPQNPYFLLYLGLYYIQTGNYEKALHYLNQARFLQPEMVAAWHCLGSLASRFGHNHEAIHYFKKAFAMGHDPNTQFRYALELLALGNYREGWNEYQNRFNVPGPNYNSFGLDGPLWNGEDLTGKTVVIAQEQGLGDSILFVRFIPLLKQLYNVSIIFVTYNSLAKLLQQVKSIDKIVTSRSAVPDYDYRIPLLSLPYYLKLYDESQFMPQPYLQADATKQKIWKNKLANLTGLNVGICWRGNPENSICILRDCKLIDHLALLEKPWLKLFSLQKDLTTEESELLKFSNVPNWGDTFIDFSDTAAAISQLDLIITVDTATGHLAGALGKKTWWLLRYDTEWRHPRHRVESPWYTNSKLIRQPKLGDWDSVFKTLDSEINTLKPSII